MPISISNVSGLTFNHLDVAGRLKHVSGMADTGGDHGEVESGWRQAPLLIKASQTHPRTAQSVNPTASTIAGCQTARGGATRGRGPSTNEWFDPAANKKKRDVRPRVAPSSTATENAVNPLKLPQSNKIEGSRKSPPSKSTANAQYISTTTVTKSKSPPHHTNSTGRPKGIRQRSDPLHRSPLL